MKKLLTLALVATLMLSVCLFTGCGQNPENAKFKCTPTDTITVSKGAAIEDAVSGLSFELDPEASYRKWNKDKGEYEDVVVGFESAKTYEECIELGMNVTGFDSSRVTAEGETRLIRFTLYGYTCSVQYMVTE